MTDQTASSAGSPRAAHPAPVGRPASLQRPMMIGKIHRATVTQADLHYVGSITVDTDLLDAADLVPGQQVDVVDVTNGARLTTYVIPGEPGAGEISINGAAAHLVSPGDVVIIIAYGMMADRDARTFLPNVVFVDETNRIVELDDDPGHAPDGFGLYDSGVPIEPFQSAGLVRTAAGRAAGSGAAVPGDDDGTPAGGPTATAPLLAPEPAETTAR